MNGFARRFVLIKREKAARKWLNVVRPTSDVICETDKLTYNFSIHLHSHSNAVFPRLWYEPHKSCFHWIRNTIYNNRVVVFVSLENLG